MQKQKSLNRVAIVGCGHVGATSAYSLLLNGAVEELVLLDKDNDLLLGEAMDLQHSVPLARPARIWAGNYEDAATADIVIITAGIGSHPGETRLDLLDRNVTVIREIMRELSAVNFGGIVLMTTNPVDILAQIAQEESGLPFEKVIGSGTVLDTARLRSMLGEELGVEAGSVHAYIIGEHGNSEIAAWSAARIGGVPLVDFCAADCPDFDKVLERVRNAAPEIIKHKGYTSFAIASCITKICEAILRNEHTILPISTMTAGQYGIEGVYLSLPCIIGSNGVERIIELPLDESERQGLLDSASLLKKTLEDMKDKSASTATKGNGLRGITKNPAGGG
jgi:L-lactate dehydrogenase